MATAVRAVQLRLAGCAVCYVNSLGVSLCGSVRRHFVHRCTPRTQVVVGNVLDTRYCFWCKTSSGDTRGFRGRVWSPMYRHRQKCVVRF